ncbi:hypothetical protein PUN28_000235 [Cardiocondyla obscurior]|uniref:Uncharacterized protein n=1 Tax=Cardiocondyla obscurior TaxID=286306 RepID=A0AAW2GYB8_9HYME
MICYLLRGKCGRPRRDTADPPQFMAATGYLEIRDDRGAIKGTESNGGGAGDGRENSSRGGVIHWRSESDNHFSYIYIARSRLARHRERFAKHGGRGEGKPGIDLARVSQCIERHYYGWPSFSGSRSDCRHFNVNQTKQTRRRY